MRRVLLIATFIRLLSIEAVCYEVNVHEKISEKAIAASNLEANLLSNLNMRLTDAFENRNILAWIEKGSNWEDDNPRWLNHFFDPTNGMGLSDMLSGRTSLEWGRDYWSNEWNWKKARQFYYFALSQSRHDKRQTNFAAAFRSLGQIVHLIHDLAVPAHVRNDAHPYKTGKYFQQQRDMYEKYTNAALSPENGLPQLKYDGYPAVDLTTFNDFNTFWINDGKGLAEFTNRNFLSRDTNFDDPSYNNYNSPGKIGEWIGKETVPDPSIGIFPVEVEVRYVQGYVTDKYRPSESKPINRLSSFSYFDYEMKKLNGQRVYTQNNFVHKEYADFLIPRAVGYSAGLLNYFFRGDIRLSYETGPIPGYVIINDTAEDLDGTFKIYYDNTKDERIEKASGDFTLRALSKGDIFDLTPPADAKEPGKYILVFKGRMGNEDGAVAGYVLSRLLEITPPDQYIYSRAESATLQFKDIRVKVKNITDEAMQNGTLQAVAKYKKTIDDWTFQHSVSTKQPVANLAPGMQAEISFDFTGSPIPSDITDLHLQVILTGKIGDEEGS